MKRIIYFAILLFGVCFLSSCQKEEKVEDYATAIIGKWRRMMGEEYKNGVIRTRDTFGKDFYKYEYFIDGKLDHEDIDDPINNYFQFFEDGSIAAISDIRTRYATFEINGTTLIIAGDSYTIKKLTRKELVYYEQESDGTEWWEYFERVE